MHNFDNILYVSFGSVNETEALKQALSLARNNSTSLTAVLMSPEFPRSLADHRQRYEVSIIEQANQAIATTRTALGLRETEVPVKIEVESGSTLAIRIIRRVLQDAHDLVVKEAEVRDGGKGFKALDMELLRKCPCPVWLCRPIQDSHNEMRVAVAIDPEAHEKPAHDLAVRLLKIARSQADTCSGELDIISCWSHEYDEYVRGNVWIQIPEAELENAVKQTQQSHRAALDALISESGIGGNYQVQHVRGRPEVMIPNFIDNNGVDILVMGTLARTGLPGFIIGNTAENIVQKVGCSLLALKPNGFVSPVKAY